MPDISDTADPGAVGPRREKTVDTKFGKLLRVAMPIIQGGLTGGFSGDWRQPGSGGRAAEQMFARRQSMAMQKRALDEQIKARHVQEIQEAARAKQAETAAATKWQDRVENGEVIRFGPNPHDPSVFDQKLGPAKMFSEAEHPKDPGQDWSVQDTNQGLVRANKATGAVEALQMPMEPQLGNLPLPGEPAAPLTRPKKQFAPQRPTVLSQGSEAIDPTTGKVIAKGAPKTFAPRAQKNEPAQQVKAKARGHAEDIWAGTKGNLNDAIKFVRGLENASPAERGAIEQELRNIARDESRKGYKALLTSPQAQKQVMTPGQ
jgi:hypothetical protein